MYAAGERKTSEHWKLDCDNGDIVVKYHIINKKFIS
jgi:hypothetical protein